MKTWFYSFLMLGAICVYQTAHAAEELLPYETPPELSEDIAFELLEDDSGLSYHFVGDPEEKGAVKFFVKNAESKYEYVDPSADRMNSIAPSAGVKLQFDF